MTNEDYLRFKRPKLEDDYSVIVKLRWKIALIAFLLGFISGILLIKIIKAEENLKPRNVAHQNPVTLTGASMLPPFKSPIKTKGDFPLPDNLYMGIIAEDTSGDYQIYLSIASVIRNRFNNGLNSGLVALKRQNLGQFVGQEYAYALKIKKIDLIKLATKAIQEIFKNNKDYVNGATHYEHTGVYPAPYWAKNMQIVKVLYPHTKKEIIFYKQLIRRK